MATTDTTTMPDGWHDHEEGGGCSLYREGEEVARVMPCVGGYATSICHRWRRNDFTGTGTYYMRLNEAKADMEKWAELYA